MTDEDYRGADPASTLPASWHRAITARVAQRVPGVQISFATSLEPVAAVPATDDDVADLELREVLASTSFWPSRPKLL